MVRAACHVSAVEKCGLLTRPVGLRGAGRRFGDVHAAEKGFARRPRLSSGGSLAKRPKPFRQVLGGARHYYDVSGKRTIRGALTAVLRETTRSEQTATRRPSRSRH